MKFNNRIVTSVELQQAGIEVYPEHFSAQVDGFMLQDKKTLAAVAAWLEARADEIKNSDPAFYRELKGGLIGFKSEVEEET